ncbi:MAG TPA: DUF4743 domain-containing protein [Acetobacteraceae bacterium]|nr:DUF4743 domain-containing protein [Acetobacteraceae bacterium]
MQRHAQDLQPDVSGFLRHVHACRNAVLPGHRLPFVLGTAQVGWVVPEIAGALARLPRVSAEPGAVRLDDPGTLPAIARALADRGVFRWRGEAFDVRADPDGPALGQIDRGALPVFGIEAIGVHVNGLIERADGLHLWIARRAADKALDPGKLDHIVAGGVPAGLTPEATLVKEAHEEAGIPDQLARRSVHVGVIRYAMERPEGLRRDLLHCYDLALPPTFQPHPLDGEVQSFELWPLARVLETVRSSDEFKFNVNLVLIDLALRRGAISGDRANRLHAALRRS